MSGAKRKRRFDVSEIDERPDRGRENLLETAQRTLRKPEVWFNLLFLVLVELAVAQSAREADRIAMEQKQAAFAAEVKMLRATLSKWQGDVEG